MDRDSSSINYSSVLGRAIKPIQFTASEILSLKSERFLITGAGGSIGSRIVSLLASIPGTEFLATDRDETALHSLSLDLTSQALFESSNYALLDVRDAFGVLDTIQQFKPTVIIHAAALKHLSALQRQPREAALTNVFGSANLVDSAISCGVSKFINISTDKAAEPTSVLGYSKHFAELYIASKRLNGYTGFTSCRFGNVFNSRGSVIETFLTQMRIGAPITLTDQEIQRYFMHVDEAAFLTLKSYLINSGDIHLFNMGHPVRMLDIVLRMQQILGSKSQILITGLRDGEKLDELLIESDSIQKTTSYTDINVLTLNIEDNPYLCMILEAIASRNESAIIELLTQNV